MIYFIACPAANAVKIGVTGERPCDVHKRVSMLQTGCPLRLNLVGTQDGSYPEEQALFERFAPGRIHGEWFQLTEELGAHIATLSIPAEPSRPARSEKLRRKWFREGVAA